MKKMYVYLIGIGIILILLASLIFTAHFALKARQNYVRAQQNLYNSDFQIDTLKTKNGELQYAVNTLTIKAKDLEELNPKLVEEIKNLKLKLKHVNTATQIQYNYTIKYDTVFVYKLTDTTFKASTKDAWSDFSCDICIANNTVEVGNVGISLKDSLILVEEIKYKGFWFWKRPVYMTLHIKSENPYFNLDKVQTYYFYKNKTPK